MLQLPFSGVARSTLALYNACLGIEPDLYTIGVHYGPLATSLPAGIHVANYGRRIPAIAWRALAFPYAARRHKCNVLHFPYNGSVVRRGIGRRCRVVTTVHDVIPLLFSQTHFPSVREEDRYRRRLQRSIDLSDLVITVSDCSRQDIVSRFNVQCPLLVLPNIVEPRQYAGEAKGLPPKYFIYLGGFDRRKGLDFLVPLYHSMFRRKRVDCPLVLVGEPHLISGEFSSCLEAAVRDRAIVLPGFIPDSDLGGWLHNAVALLFPSRYEGFGYAPLEAMQCGCPVIAARCGAIPEVCADAAVLCRPDDEGEWEAAIGKLADDIELRESMIVRGHHQASLYSAPPIARKFLAELRRVTG